MGDVGTDGGWVSLERFRLVNEVRFGGQEWGLPSGDVPFLRGYPRPSGRRRGGSRDGGGTHRTRRRDVEGVVSFTGHTTPRTSRCRVRRRDVSEVGGLTNL